MTDHGSNAALVWIALVVLLSATGSAAPLLPLAVWWFVSAMMPDKRDPICR